MLFFTPCFHILKRISVAFNANVALDEIANIYWFVRFAHFEIDLPEWRFKFGAFVAY